VARTVAKNLPVLGMLAALAGFLALQVIAYLHAGAFEYPLDDVYIHLAMASKIAQGTYGVNAGEPASAASSILYPLLILPFPGTEFQRFLPLFWNALAVAGCGWVWGRIVEEISGVGAVAWIIALGAPLAFNVSGVGFTGMEAAPHILASLLIVLGLWRALAGQGIAGWFVAAVILAPLLRYEGLALSLLAAAALFLHGERRTAAMIAVATVLPVAAFSLFLVSLGLDPLPNSVIAKLSEQQAEVSALARPFVNVLVNLIQPAGQLLALQVILAALGFLALPELRRGPQGLLLATVALAALAHLLLGKLGWMHRYEPYALFSLAGAFVLAASALSLRTKMLGLSFVLLMMAGAGNVYMPKVWRDYVWNPRAIHLQQAQMARFAQDYLEAPVAVNDLGRVAWRNPDYVLDLWGLGSTEARRIRLGKVAPADGWAAPLAARHGVKAAMIYDRWLSAATGPSWVRLGELSVDVRRGFLGDVRVAFYATDPSYVPEVRAMLQDFSSSLPVGAVLNLTGPGA
jgi:hypothetical protein